MAAKKPSKRVGSGGKGKRALEGKGPTPKAEDRHWYRDGKKPGRATSGRPGTRRPQRQARPDGPTPPDVVCGKNPVVEALRAGVPATQITMGQRLARDQRVNEILDIASKKNIPLAEVTTPELDRLAGPDVVHQGIILTVPAYRYADPIELADRAIDRGQRLLVAADGITDPRNLGAIVRSTAAFGGAGVIVPKRRSVGVTPGVWKTSAGQLTHAPVAQASNLTHTLKALQERGFFVVGLAGDRATPIGEADLGDVPVVLVVGAEGAGLSRLVRETCDLVVSIPIDPKTESLNASVATGIALYEIGRQKA